MVTLSSLQPASHRDTGCFSGRPRLHKDCTRTIRCIARAICSFRRQPASTLLPPFSGLCGRRPASRASVQDPCFMKQTAEAPQRLTRLTALDVLRRNTGISGHFSTRLDERRNRAAIAHSLTRALGQGSMSFSCSFCQPALHIFPAQWLASVQRPGARRERLVIRATPSSTSWKLVP
jgi:hypothetical protein